MENPFTLSFGKSPSTSIDRPIQTKEIVNSFQALEPNNQIFLITGVRGYGKTVLMTDVAKELLQDNKWIHIELNPTRDLISSLLTKLNSNKRCLETLKNAKINLSFFGFSLGFQGVPEIKDPEIAVSQILEQMKKHGKRLLITIDEATNTPQMQTFASMFQILLREDAPIYLLMTGLYQNINELQNVDNLTFLFRAPKIYLTPLNLTAIASEYKRIFNCSENDAKEMANLTRGYPFGYQVLGYLTFRNDGDYKDVLVQYQQYLTEYVYEKLWSEMSIKDQEVARGIAKAGEGATKKIREELNMTQNEFNPYRNRLLKKGIILADARGSVRFTLPLFDKFCLGELVLA